MRQNLIGAGFSLLGSTGLHRLAPSGLRGIGAILMFHHVRPRQQGGFQPNGLLEITPAFLEAVIRHLRELSYDIVSLDAAVARIGSAATGQGRPFAVLSFDDGYRDNAEYALPILERLEAPFTLFVTPGFADRTARLWWTELEHAIRRLPEIDISIGAERLRLRAGTAKEKQAAFEAIYARLRRGSEAQLLDVVAELRTAAKVDSPALVEGLCMNWNEIAEVSRHPLATVGAHTMTHPRLAKLDAAAMLAEMAESRDTIEDRIGRTVRHLAYPVGDPSSAGPREFAAAQALGFASAVTTRPGVVFAEHADHLLALPRLSVNGKWQDLRNVEVLLSGAAFALWNRGRRVNAA